MDNNKREYVQIELEKGTGELIAAGLSRMFGGLSYVFEDTCGALMENPNNANKWLTANYETLAGAVAVADALSEILYDYLSAADV